MSEETKLMRNNLINLLSSNDIANIELAIQLNKGVKLLSTSDIITYLKNSWLLYDGDYIYRKGWNGWYWKYSDDALKLMEITKELEKIAKLEDKMSKYYKPTSKYWRHGKEYGRK